MVLVFHITAATKMPDWLDGFLKEKMYTFVGFDITRDKLMLKNSGLEINPEKFINMQKKWRHPYIDKPYDSLAEVASMVVHPFYKHMKQKINRNEDHKLWGIAPLPDHLIQYAAIDAYATYKAWKTNDIVIKGLYRLNYDENFGTMDTYGSTSSKKEGHLVKAKRPRVDCDEVAADTRVVADHYIKDEVVVKFDNLFSVNAVHGKNFKQGATSNNYAVMMATKVVELKPCKPDWFGLTKT
ncbi:hypothetical protein ZWY2020_043197 [Hordeum vulgare]|nr:hypothetical protein ZWY2020_043197 [Hordeum vulgare]